MARNIKGLTIEIGGDTTKLQSALKGVNGKIKETQAALRDVDKLLKLDPGNTTLLKQKYELLGKSIDDTKDKLKTLKDAEAQAMDQFARGEISKGEFDALQREIIETEQSLKSLQDEYKDFGSVAKQQAMLAAQEMEKLGGKVQDIGGKVSSMGAGLTRGVTAPIIGLGVAAVSAFNEVDNGFDIVIQKTGAAGEAAEEMHEVYDNLATTLPTSFEEVGNAVGEVNTRFALMGDDLERLSAQFIKFADLNGMDVTSAIDSTQKAMVALGVPTERAAVFLDALNEVGQRTGADLSKLTSDLSANAAQFKQMGLSASEVVNFLGDCEVSSLDASKAMVGLNSAMKKAAKDGKTLPEALKDFQKEMEGSESATEKLESAIALFGSKAGPQIMEAVQNGSLSFDNFNNTLGETVGNINKTYDATKDGTDQMTVAMNTLKEAGAEIGAILSDMLPSVINPLIDAIKTFAGWWKSLSEEQQQFIIQAALVAAAVGPLLSIIGSIISAVGSIMTLAPQIVSAISTVIGVVKGLFALLLANPIGLVVAAIAALVAGFIYLWNNCEEFRQFWIDLWNDIVKFAQEAWTAISKGWDDLVQSATEAWTSMSEGWTRLWDGLSEKFHTVWDGIKSFMSGIVDWLKNVFDFEWKLPQIKLPHFEVTGEFDASVFPPKFPHIDVEWYKKAQDNAYLLDGATIFGSRGGNLLGGGEAGSEMVVGKDHLLNMISQAQGGGISPDALRVAFVEALAGMEMVAPVYIGQDRLDDAVAKVTLRSTYRSGGRR